MISSTYSDDDDDVEQSPPHQGGTLTTDVAEDDQRVTATDSAADYHTPSQLAASIDDSAPEFVAPRSRPVTPQLVQQQQHLTIVDYGHDEVAMSPEAEGREVMAAGVVMIENQIQMTNGNEKTLLSAAQSLSPATQATTPIQEQLNSSGSQAMDFTMSEPESTQAGEPVKDSVDGVTDDDLVVRFLPPSPKAKCSDEQQKRINKFLSLKRLGKSYNAEVRNKKEYRNPDFLRHAVTYQDIDEIGSCFRKEVFDPHGYDKSDFYDEIEADMKREMERKEQERKKNQKVEFVAGGAQSGIVAPSPKISIPIPAVPTVTVGGLRSVSAAVDSTTRDGRNKKSKWDKVDGDQTSGAHAALSTVANAGAGYAAFAQQRRRETEEKKYIERKIDRRS